MIKNIQNASLGLILLATGAFSLSSAQALSDVVLCDDVCSAGHEACRNECMKSFPSADNLEKYTMCTETVCATIKKPCKDACTAQFGKK